MLEFRELDEHTTFFDQLGSDAPGEIVLINVFGVAPEDADKLLEVWTEDARFMSAQPGYVTAQLHRGIGDSTTFVNVAVWRSVANLRAAVTSPEFQTHLQAYPESTTASPHVFRRVAVPGICPG
jgi:heme-degrading monooxygenase HmoA